MNKNDKKMFEQIVEGWWVYTQGICKFENEWLLVAGRLQEWPTLLNVTDGERIVSRNYTDIIAIHYPLAPSAKVPYMETAYMVNAVEAISYQDAIEKILTPNSCKDTPPWRIRIEGENSWKPVLYRDSVSFRCGWWPIKDLAFVAIKSPFGQVFNVSYD